MDIKKRNLRKTLYNFIVFVGILFLILYYIYGVFSFKVIFGIVGITIYIYEHKKVYKDKGLLILNIFLVILVVAILIKPLIYQTYTGLGNLLFITAQIGYAISIYKNKVPAMIPIILFSLSSLFIMYNLFSGIDPNDIFIRHSRNHISILLIFLVVFLYITYYKENNKILLWPSFITLFISIQALGRAGILSSMILFISILFIKFIKQFSIFKNIIIMFPLYIIGLLVLYNNIDVILAYLLNDIKLSDMNYSDDVRQDIIKSYLNSIINIKQMIFGLPYGDTSSFYGGYTLHNSYVNAHFKYGIFAFPIFVLILVAIIKGVKNNILYFILLITILIRGFTDTIFIGESFDFIFFALLASLIGDSFKNINGSDRPKKGD